MTTRSIQQFICVLLSVALLTGGLAPPSLMAQTEDDPPPPTGIRFDTPPYAVDGPYAVGVRYFTIPAEAESDRELTASVWYPALNPEGETGQMVYAQQFEPGQAPPFSVLGHALLDAEPDAGGGPYPLIVYSHGHWSMAQELPYFTEHLASRGFVIISVDHQDNWSTAFGPMAYEAQIRRQQEVTREIDFAEALSADDGALSGMISTEKVGVAGWSRGAVTTWAAAGARMDLETLRAWCKADPKRLDSPSAGTAVECIDMLEHEAEMAEFAGLNGIPSGLWPSWYDERIAAAIPLSGRTASFGSEGIRHVNVPVLMFHGGLEEKMEPGLVMGNPYENMGSERKISVVFEHAGHVLYNSSCANNPDIAAMFPGFCVDPVWDMDRAHDLINHFSTAFLLAELKGDEEAAAALASDQVSFPGVQYREKGYGVEPEPEPAPPPQGIRFDAPPYAVSGPYAVGVRYFTIPAEMESDRELTTSVWYPALNPEGETGRMIYEQQFEPGNIPPFSTLGHALLDAEPDADGGPYPLIVYSHAHWSMAQEVPYLTEHLASRGFVVISADHEDNWSTDFGPMAYEALIRRHQEVARQIDFAEALSTEDGSLSGLIATAKVGVAGWSMGGATSLGMAGARIDLTNLRAWCEEDPLHPQVASWACVDNLDHEAEMAVFAGLDDVPEGLWPTFRDDRVAAAVRLSGSTVFFGSAGLSSVDIPVLLFHGGAEAIANPGIQMGHPYESVSSARKVEVALDGAGHYPFFSGCADAPDVYNLSLAIGFPTFCADPVWDMDRAHDLINHFATAFLLAELKGDSEAAAALAAEQVSFPGVQYRAEGYDATGSLPSDSK